MVLDFVIEVELWAKGLTLIDSLEHRLWTLFFRAFHYFGTVFLSYQNNISNINFAQIRSVNMKQDLHLKLVSSLSMLIPFSIASSSKPWNRPYHIFMEWLCLLLAGRNCRISTWEALQAKSHDAWCPSGHWCSCKRRCRRNGEAWFAFEHSFCYRVMKCHQFVGTLFSSVNLFKPSVEFYIEANHLICWAN